MGLVDASESPGYELGVIHYIVVIVFDTTSDTGNIFYAEVHVSLAVILYAL